MRDLNLYHFFPQIMQKSKLSKLWSQNRPIHVCIFNDGSQNDTEIEVLNQSTVQTFKHSVLEIHYCVKSTEFVSDIN